MIFYNTYFSSHSLKFFDAKRKIRTWFLSIELIDNKRMNRSWANNKSIYYATLNTILILLIIRFNPNSHFNVFTIKICSQLIERWITWIKLSDLSFWHEHNNTFLITLRKQMYEKWSKIRLSSFLSICEQMNIKSLQYFFVCNSVLEGTDNYIYVMV